MMENEVVCKCKDRVELRPGVRFEHVAKHVNIGDRTMIMRMQKSAKDEHPNRAFWDKARTPL